jgi:thiamine transport system ATP-binding protein
MHTSAMLEISQLAVALPDGTQVLRDVSMQAHPGEAIALMGPSGAGKTTLLKALFDRESLEAEGFEISCVHFAAGSELALVPQRGALFDHVDAAGNIELAMRHGVTDDRDAGRWLQAVELDPDWVLQRRPVNRLSGGQAQRLAVARALASGRRILFLDEPTVGLDPSRVRGLATQLRTLCDQGAVVVVITHDTQFAAELADRVFMLQHGTLQPIDLPRRQQPGCRATHEMAGARYAIESALFGAIPPNEGPGRPASPFDPGKAARRLLRTVLDPFAVLARAPLEIPGYALSHPQDFAHVSGYALRQSLLRPLPFYFVVSLLLGFTVLYVLASFGGEFGPGQAISIVRGLPLIALAPPLTAFLFVAASSNSVNAWLGGMKLTGQTGALEALGISRRAYLWGPAWAALVVAFLAVSFVFALGFLSGSVLLCALYDIPDALAIMTGDLFDPPPERAVYRIRAFALVVIYACGCASDTIARADEPKDGADAVTRAMTRSVVYCTLFVVAWELASLGFVRAWGST